MCLRIVSLVLLMTAGSFSFAQVTIDSNSPEPIRPFAGSLLVSSETVPEGAYRQFVQLAGGEDAKLFVLGSPRDPFGEATFVDDPALATGIWVGKKATAVVIPQQVEQLRGHLERGAVVGSNCTALFGVAGLLPGSMVFFDKELDDAFVSLEQHPGTAGYLLGPSSAMEVRDGRRILIVGDPVVAMVGSGGGRARETESLESRSSQRRGVRRQRYAADLLAWSRRAQTRLLAVFPRANPPVPEVRQGSLLIVGGGRMGTKLWDRFVTEAGGKDAKIVCIPTASGQPEGNKRSGGAGALRRYGCTNVTVLHTLDRRKANDEAFCAPLVGATAVWFDGGRQWRLVDSYQNTRAHQLMLDVLKRGGCIGGSSAGASIQGDYMARGAPRGPGWIAAPGYETGLGFLPGVAIDQHFHQRRRMADMTHLMGLYPQILGLGIDEGTAVFVKEHTALVLGEAVVSFYDRQKPVVEGELDHLELRDGDRYDLKKRSPIKMF